MKAIKTLLAVSALTAAAATQAATVASYSWAETGSSTVHTQTASGTATLSDTGVLTITGSGNFFDSVGLGVNDSLNVTEIYNGTISGTTWTASGTGSYQFSNCQIVAGPNFCGLIPTAASTFTSASGSIDLTSTSLSTLTAGFTMVVAGGPVPVSVVDKLTPAVPVPAAAWLFGSGLIGLAGTARRRTK